MSLRLSLNGCRWTWHSVEAWTTRPGYPAKREELEAFAKRYGDNYRETLKSFEPNSAGRLERAGELSVWIQDLLAGGRYATVWTERAADGARIHIATVADCHPEAGA